VKLNLFKRWSIKQRVTVFTLAIFAASIWSIAFYSGRVLRTNMERQLGDLQFSTASFMAAHINGELAERLNALKKTAEKISPELMGNAAGLQAFLEDRPVLQSLFNAGAYIAGPDGTATASIPVAVGRVGVNFMDRDHVAAALKEGRAAISQPVIGKKLNAPCSPWPRPSATRRAKQLARWWVWSIWPSRIFWTKSQATTTARAAATCWWTPCSA
jgi:hypothetical protein